MNKYDLVKRESNHIRQGLGNIKISFREYFPDVRRRQWVFPTPCLYTHNFPVLNKRLHLRELTGISSYGIAKTKLFSYIPRGALRVSLRRQGCSSIKNDPTHNGPIKGQKNYLTFITSPYIHRLPIEQNRTHGFCSIMTTINARRHRKIHLLDDLEEKKRLHHYFQ